GVRADQRGRRPVDMLSLVVVWVAPKPISEPLIKERGLLALAEVGLGESVERHRRGLAIQQRFSVLYIVPFSTDADALGSEPPDIVKEVRSNLRPIVCQQVAEPSEHLLR